MFKSYRNKLIGSFAFLVMLSIFIAGISLFHQHQVRQIDTLSLEAERIYSLILIDGRSINDFLTYAPSSPAFFDSHTSPELESHQRLVQQITASLDLLHKNVNRQLNTEAILLPNIIDAIKQNDVRIQQMSTLIQQRGFWKYGTVGRMRESVHLLEQSTTFDMADLLSLRRREKDYIIRFDSVYVVKLLAESQLMLEKLAQNREVSEEEALFARTHLQAYVNSFQELVALDHEMGIRNQQALKAEIDQAQGQIQANFGQVLRLINREKESANNWITTVYILTLISILLGGAIMGFYLANRLSNRIHWLSNAISSFISSGFKQQTSETAPYHVEDEVGLLTSNFLLLQERITTYIQELRHEKTVADQANQSKSMFLANMSHEIRTPLNGVVGISQLLSDTTLSASQQEYLDILNISSKKLLGIINDILDFSKIESGKLRLESTDFSLIEEVEKSIKVLQTKAIEKDIILFSTHTPGIPVLLKGDPTRIAQILFNLIGNAIKFTEEGSIEVKTTLLEQAEERYLVKIEVIDTGIGISPSVREKLFKPFSQADESTTRKFGGTGLGLAITQEIVRLMDGQMGVESEAGKGSTFRVTLPLRLGSPSETKAQSSPPTHKSSSNGLHVLLVEDNAVNQKIAKLMLRKLGYTVTISANGEEAVAEVKKQTIDLVLMDIQMPIMDGYEATAEIRKLQASQAIAHFPIVALTANATESDRHKALSADMDDFLTKPLKIEQLQLTIHKHTRYHSPLT